MKRVFVPLLTLAALSFAVVSSCTSTSVTSKADSAAATNVVPQNADITRIMNTCAKCHKPWNSKSDVAGQDGWIVPGDPIASRFYRMIRKNHMRGATRLTDDDPGIVYNYIRNMKGEDAAEKTGSTGTAGGGAMTNFHLRIHCGAGKNYKGGDYVDPDGNTWLADRQYKKGGWGYDGGGAHWHPYGNPQTIQNTTMPDLYRSERSGMDSYRITVPANGKYTVKLHFAENFDHINTPEQRVFSIFIGGKEVIKDLDVNKEVGSYEAIVKTVETEVTDGLLAIEFVQKAQWGAMINAIEVISKKAE